MDQQTKFKTALAALAASAETKDRKLTKADVKEFLEDMDLGEEQMKLVYAYLAYYFLFQKVPAEIIPPPVALIHRKMAWQCRFEPLRSDPFPSVYTVH